MATQSYAASLLRFSRKKSDFNPGVQPATVKQKKYWLTHFIRNLNPVNWFKEFTHIEITLEEFEVKKPSEVSIVKDRLQGLASHTTYKINTMKSAVNFLIIILFFVLSSRCFGQVIIQADETRFKTAGDRPGNSGGTPVYSKSKTDTTGILEIDYPGAAANFAAVFPLATNQVWIREAGSLYVSFTREGKKVSAVFTPQGAMSYSIAFIRLADIPVEIIEKIKTSYGGYSIVSAKEITIDDNTIYQVLLETLFEYIVIRFGNGEMEETEKVKKYSGDCRGQ
jgi:hypothetical protein